MARDEEMLVTWNESTSYSRVTFPFSVQEEINLIRNLSGKTEGK